MILQKQFNSMIKASFPNGIPIHQEKELRRAFFGGAITMMTQLHITAGSPLEFDNMMKNVDSEIKSYAEELRTEAAVFNLTKDLNNDPSLN